MKRFLIAACAIAVATSLVATPSFAGTGSGISGVPAVDTDPNAIYVPADDLSQDANDLAKLMRDKMPFVSREPKLVGNQMVFAVDVSPMRLFVSGRKLLDRVGGTVTISRPGVNLTLGSFIGDPKGKVLLKRTLPSRLVTKAGEQVFTVTLPSEVAADLRKISKRE